jgi:hypothetical protein
MADKKVSQLNSLDGASVDLSTDLLVIVDASASESKQITGTSLLNGINNLDTLTKGEVSASTDLITIYDSSASTSKKISIGDSIDNVITDQRTYSSGYEAVVTGNDWSSNGNGATKTYTHNLGTSDVLVQLFAADNVYGNNSVLVSLDSILPDRIRSKSRTGAQVHSITSVSLTVQLGGHGYSKLNAGGLTLTQLPWSWIKVIVRK